MYSDTLQNTHNHHHNHGQHQRKWPPYAPNEASSPATTGCMDGQQPTERAVIILGRVRGCIVIKVLICSSDDASPQHWSVLRVIHPLNLTKIMCTCLGGLPPLSNDDGVGCKASCGVREGHFCRRWSWSVVVEMVVVGRWRLVTSFF